MSAAQSTALAPAAFTRFGDLLRFLRRRAQLTQRELSIAVGYNFAQICRLEQGQRLPDRTVVAAAFIPALGLELAPEWAARLVELAAAARQERHKAALAALVPTPAVDQGDEALVEGDALEGIPTPAPYEVPRLHLVARLHARLVSERRVALVGLPGMGKTTLAAALAREYAESTPVFWLTLTSGVTTSIEAVVRHLALFLSAHGQDQARTLLRRADDASAALPLDRQLSLIASALARLASQGSNRRGAPPLLCFDNAHLAQEDDDIVRVLQHLSATTPARMLLTSREHLPALPGCPQVRLGGLDAEEGLELIAQLTAHFDDPTESPAWATSLLDKTGGSPMLLQLALGELADERTAPAALIASLESQPQIAAYLLETVRRHVSPTAWGLLALVSVFRQPVNLHSPALIELIHEADAAYDLDATLDELTRRHVIDHPARAKTHPLVRDYAYAGLLRLPLHRRQLHRIAAEWSEQGIGDPLEASYHYRQAGDLAAAAAALADNVETIGQRGVAFAAADSAEEILLEARRQRGDMAETVRRLLIVRGDLLVHTLRAQEAEASYREALALTNAADERARIAFRLAQSLTQRGQAAEAVSLCQGVLAALGPSEVALRAQLYAAEGQAHLALASYADAAQAAHDALALVEQLSGAAPRLASEVRVRAQRVLGIVARDRHDFDAALGFFQRASQAAEQAAMSALAWRCRMDEADMLFLRGNLAGVLERCAALMPQLRAAGDSYTIGQALSLTALSHLLNDDLAAGLEAAEQAYALREEIGDRQGLVIAANQRALLLIALNRIAKAGELVAHTLATSDLTGEMYALGFLLEKQAIVQMLEGDALAAQATLRRALDLPVAARDLKLHGDLCHDLAVALLMIEAIDEAQAVLEDRPDESGLWVELEYRLIAGLIARARGDLEAARVATDDLAARASAVGCPLYVRKAQRVAAAAMPLDYPRLVWVMGLR